MIPSSASVCFIHALLDEGPGALGCEEKGVAVVDFVLLFLYPMYLFFAFPQN
jgi:hypothetical protein